jgi:CheY-like chemotaxis protein
VVEDDQSIRQMILETLRTDGYQATGVADTPAALAHVRQQRPDLIITDYHLPGADGLQLLRSLRDEGFGDIPTLVISADVRPPDFPSASFIPKPFELDTILRAVRRALGRSSSAEQRIVTDAPHDGFWRTPGIALA